MSRARRVAVRSGRSSPNARPCSARTAAAGPRALLPCWNRRCTGAVVAASPPTPAGLAAWLEATWIALGGPACVDTEALANARVFFTMLAGLSPDGLAIHTDEFDRRLDRLFALPDPGASERHGLQLMTIHKAKGLGFDAVIVPGLERKPASDKAALLCWTLRSNPETGDPELLLAPIGRKGVSGQSSHYSWVAKQKRAAVHDEAKRLLYVACSRAAHELHLFAAPSLRTGKSTGQARPSPEFPDSLLAVGWPALGPRCVDDWRERERARNDAALQTAASEAAASAIASANGHASRVLQFPSTASGTPGLVPGGLVPGLVPALAAAAEQETTAAPPLWRLPMDWAPAAAAPLAAATRESSGGHLPAYRGSRRREETEARAARLRGNVIHSLLAELARSVVGAEVPVSSIAAHFYAGERRWRAAAAALLRNAGVLSSPEMAAHLKFALDAVTNTVEDGAGRWLLSAHPGAQTEVALSLSGEGSLNTARPDRVFFAGTAPSLLPLFDAGESDHLWIVDYKTSGPSPTQDRAAFLASEWEQYAAQLEHYSELLRALFPEKPQRLALYYPLLPHLDWRPA